MFESSSTSIKQSSNKWRWLGQEHQALKFGGCWSDTKMNDIMLTRRSWLPWLVWQCVSGQRRSGHLGQATWCQNVMYTSLSLPSQQQEVPSSTHSYSSSSAVFWDSSRLFAIANHKNFFGFSSSIWASLPADASLPWTSWSTGKNVPPTLKVTAPKDVMLIKSHGTFATIGRASVPSDAVIITLTPRIASWILNLKLKKKTWCFQLKFSLLPALAGNLRSLKVATRFFPSVCAFVNSGALGEVAEWSIKEKTRSREIAGGFGFLKEFLCM